MYEVTPLVEVVTGRSVCMNCRFVIEAKSFCLSAKDGCPEYHLTTASWLVDSLEEACLLVKRISPRLFGRMGRC
jgi:hypothetical protein